MTVKEGALLDDWTRFVLRHQHPGNLAVHFVSMLWFYGGPPAAVLDRDARWLLLFFASGFLGGLGHWWFDDGRVDWREMTSRPEVPHYVVIMFWRIFTGKWPQDTERARDAARRAGIVV
ncbi:MAG: hypothetical protein HY553_02375 [Elusimicrobia bacterium]|nr:hypothetical protein [Elusimicrobiota bacterium]